MLNGSTVESMWWTQYLFLKFDLNQWLLIILVENIVMCVCSSWKLLVIIKIEGRT